MTEEVGRAEWTQRDETDGQGSGGRGMGEEMRDQRRGQGGGRQLTELEKAADRKGKGTRRGKAVRAAPQPAANRKQEEAGKTESVCSDSVSPYLTPDT